MKVTTKKEFKIWLATHELTQLQVAQKLGITDRTITVYNGNGRYPLIFQYALKGLENELQEHSA